MQRAVPDGGGLDAVHPQALDKLGQRVVLHVRRQRLAIGHEVLVEVLLVDVEGLARPSVAVGPAADVLEEGGVNGPGLQLHAVLGVTGWQEAGVEGGYVSVVEVTVEEHWRGGVVDQLCKRSEVLLVVPVGV